MKIKLHNLFFFLIIVALVASCSRKKDSFLSRNYHALTTQYNILYNGNLSLEKGKQAIEANFQDNYWSILPIEKLTINENAIVTAPTNQDFERAEEKAVKAVQKHGMNIQGKEKNPQIDEAYLLLGKARYYDQRFIPAQEAFNYILYKYPASDNINQAKIWREKVNIRLENDELAIRNLKRLLDQEELEKQDLADATAMLAQAYMNLKHLDTALTHIDVAANTTKNNAQKGRYRFIQGQLYNTLGDKDSANIAFEKVIELNRKIPRIYHIAAHLEKAKNFNYQTGNKLAFLEYLTKMEENRENRPFLDKIYHQIAQYHLNNKSDSLAIAYYNKSLRKTTTDKVLNAKNYNTLAEINFNASQYKEAGAYYDSTMLNMKQNSKPYRLVKRKRDNLEDVINYEGIAQNNDSILSLVAMNEAQRLEYFNNFIAQLKVKIQKEKEAQEAAAAQAAYNARNNSSGNFNSSNQNTFGATKGSKSFTRGDAKSISATKNGYSTTSASNFYFYNQQTVAYGKQEFERKWGNRAMGDDWRWSNKIATDNIVINPGEDIVASASEEEKFNPEYYISKIPSEQKVIDSLQKKRNFAYYQLGIIYKEKFKEYQLAKDRLQELLKSNPEERLILPAKYNLYKIYTLLNQTDQANIAKADIINNFPESRYAAILQNPELAATENENSPENLYETLYLKLENQDYKTVIDKSNEYITLFHGETIVPKFELLKAIAIGRLHGFEAYKEAVNYVALNYPNASEGKQAEALARNAFPLLQNNQFVEDTGAEYKVVYQFTNPTQTELTNFVNTLNPIIERVPHFNLTVSIDVYNENTTFVLVHGLTSIDGAKGFAQILQEKDRHKITKPFFAISTENYRILQIHKNLNAYIENK